MSLTLFFVLCMIVVSYSYLTNKSGNIETVIRPPPSGQIDTMISPPP